MEKTSLTALVRRQLESARYATSGRSAQTIYGGHGHMLRQTLIALKEGYALDEHDRQGEATLHVLHGRVRLLSEGDGWDAMAGDLLVIPDRRHAVEALEDAAFLLTVALPR
ncbi:hypothetical protein BN1051_01433 [Arthrobacter saudimassiliensis]|uniref:Cupin domain protein n=1 Tax=Arthrobacter saudimassiliensis TaxID=1461584 RepID=A0A078MTG7_9MICC|nr:hypothetical protein BN1051_01433 [Arthrobacter saudimassiliensis]